MKKLIVPVVCLLASASGYALAEDAAAPAAEKPVAKEVAEETATDEAAAKEQAGDLLKTVPERGCYALSYQQGTMLKKEYPGLHIESVKAGVEDTCADKPSRVDPNDMLAAQMKWQGINGVGDPSDKEITRNEAGEMIPTTVAQRGSYAIGRNIANLLTQQLIVMDADAVVLGLQHAYGDAKPLMDEETRKAAFDAYLKFGQEKREEMTAKATEAAKKFLEENAKKEGVTTTESGLQYKVLKAGEGDKPKATDKVRVHYTGTLLSGKVFDSSVERGTPAEFPLNGVIKGWTEGLQLMKEGAKFRFWIPSELAYGQRGAGADIGPNETLIFEVELLDILN